ncbi:MAG: LysR family transcriptional regulator [Ktedonobacteraceae bacterium]|nr:LysR family transcriptional regulator [Ktedonobacteraceae bacterium]
MELRQLTYFLTAVQTLSFRKAAELCFVAQPALGRQIAALEEELGVSLFTRAKQRITVTAAGKEFAIYARNALEQLQQGQQAMINMQEGVEGTITLGCVEPLATAFLPAIFHSFHQRYPGVHLNVQVIRTDDMMTLVEHGELDLGLIFDPTIRPEVLVFKELFRQSLHVLMPAQHPLAQRQQALTLEEILTEPLVLLRQTSRLRRIIDRILMQRGMVVQPIVELDSMEGLKELVKQGSGITLMLPAVLGSNQGGDEVAIAPLADVPEQFIFALVYRRFGSISKPARQFINAITQDGAINDDGSLQKGRDTGAL